MKTPHEAGGRKAAPNQEELSDRAAGFWPGRKSDGYENPSLERYSDLRFDDQPRKHRRWVMVLAAILVLIPLAILSIMGSIYWQARHDEARQVDAIIVLGAAQYNGRPTDVFEARLQHTLDLYNQGLARWIIVTGGNQPGDVYTEAGTAEAWLMNRGVPQDAILMEDVGRDTWQNIEGAWNAAQGHDIKTVLIVSDGFHLFRAERMANAVGFEAYSSPASGGPIKPWSANEFSYVIRETGAVISQFPKWVF